MGVLGRLGRLRKRGCTPPAPSMATMYHSSTRRKSICNSHRNPSLLGLEDPIGVVEGLSPEGEWYEFGREEMHREIIAKPLWLRARHQKGCAPRRFSMVASRRDARGLGSA